MRCVLLHPHPDLGGNQHNNVISALAAAVLEEAVRFDFASADLAIATRQVLEHLEDGPAWLVGYSFGGGVASLVADPRVLGWCLIAPALAMVEPVIGPDPRPKHVLAAERDAYFPPDSLQQATAGWAATTHDVVAGADHFLVGHETDVAARCAAWLAAPRFVVRPVALEETRALRQAVLRPHQRPEDLAAHEQEDAFAVGAFAGDELVAVGLVGPEGGPGSWRVRGMATAPHARGQGAGAAVLAALVEHAIAQGATRLWANVRVPAIALYARAGFAVTSEEFELPKIGPHVVMEALA